MCLFSSLALPLGLFVFPAFFSLIMMEILEPLAYGDLGFLAHDLTLAELKCCSQKREGQSESQNSAFDPAKRKINGKGPETASRCSAEGAKLKSRPLFLKERRNKGIGAHFVHITNPQLESINYSFFRKG